MNGSARVRNAGSAPFVLMIRSLRPSVALLSRTAPATGAATADRYELFDRANGADVRVFVGGRTFRRRLGRCLEIPRGRSGSGGRRSKSAAGRLVFLRPWSGWREPCPYRSGFDQAGLPIQKRPARGRPSSSILLLRRFCFWQICGAKRQCRAGQDQGG